MDFFSAYALTVAIEAVALFLMLRKERKTSEIAINAAIASSLTLPFVWFVFGGLELPWIARIAMAEGFAVLAEAGFYKLAFKGMTTGRALLASFICNAASFAIGLLVP